MKISASTYSFNRLLLDKRETQLSLIPLVKNMGYDAIEFVNIHPHDSSSKEEYAAKLCAECKKHELEISNLTLGADFFGAFGGDTRAQIEDLKKSIDLALILGAKSIRHDATNGDAVRSFDLCLPSLADAIRDVTEYGASKGVTTMVENHGYFCQDSYRVEKLFNAVNHPNFGLLCDMGNFLCADEAPDKAFGIVAKYAKYVHAKDFHVKSGLEPNPGEGFFKSRGGNYLRGAIIGHGNVPILLCLRTLMKYKYDGYIAIEFEGMEDNYKAMTIGLDNLKRYIELAKA